ncbi:hypothetical protein GN956_G15586 [Arapaima gigas]
MSEETVTGSPAVQLAGGLKGDRATSGMAAAARCIMGNAGAVHHGERRRGFPQLGRCTAPCARENPASRTTRPAAGTDRAASFTCLPCSSAAPVRVEPLLSPGGGRAPAWLEKQHKPFVPRVRKLPQSDSGGQRRPEWPRSGCSSSSPGAALRAPQPPLPPPRPPEAL